MRTVDSSAWIEVLTGSPTGHSIMELLPGRESWLVPTLVQFEIHKWLTRTMSVDRANEFISFSTHCVVASLDSEIAILASELSIQHKLSAADAIIFATAMRHGSDLLTCDAHFEGLSHVIYISKMNN